MRGPDALRDQIARLLADEVPRKLPLLREAWGLDANMLPDPGLFVSGDVPDEMVDNTIVNVVNPRLLRAVRTGDISAFGEPEYHCRYANRVYIWALGKDWDLAQRARDTLVAACRLSLFQYPQLVLDQTDTGYRVEEDTYTEDFGVPLRASSKAARTFAGAILSIDVTAEEYIDAGSTIPALGMANTITATPYAVGPLIPFQGED